jgi:hypothetical protein
MPITSVSRPAYHVAGLLTGKPKILAISTELASAGVDAAAVEILCGERGAAILDEHGRSHGLGGRIVRAFQRLARPARPRSGAVARPGRRAPRTRAYARQFTPAPWPRCTPAPAVTCSPAAPDSATRDSGPPGDKLASSN